MRTDKFKNLVKKFRRGQILVFMVAFLTIGILFSGLVVDVSLLNYTRQNMKKAADAAALAAAMDINNLTAADASAKTYAEKNGYKDGVNGTTVTTIWNPTGHEPSWIRVVIRTQFHFIFGQFIGLTQRSISVFSTAQYNTIVPISINLAGIYGMDNPQVTLAIRGRDTLYEHGDPISVPTYDDGRPNPRYDPTGYNYNIYVPSNYAEINGNPYLKVEIWDPDSYGNYDSTGAMTTTYYRLYKPDSTLRDYSDDVLLATYSCGGSSSTSGKWICPSGFTIDTRVYGTGVYRLNVRTTSGYNANGFSLRAGPSDDTTFNSNNGTAISASGPIDLRFNQTGSVKVKLGYVPSSAAGYTMHINKFDTDIGSSEIFYSCDSLPQTFPGVLAGNAEWREDLIQIPTNYSGGTWYANYYAGITDVSFWEMWYEGMDQNQSGFPILVE